MILPPHNKDCAIFERADRRQVLRTPSSQQSGDRRQLHLARRIAQSRPLGSPSLHRHSRPGMWDSARVGAGAAPIRTTEGWLEIYHGADERQPLLPRRTALGSRSRLGK